MAYIEAATKDTSEGVLKDLEFRAKALERTSHVQESEASVHQKKIIGMQDDARREQAGAEEESRRAMAGDGGTNVHAGLYADIAFEASGIGPWAKAGKDIYEMMTDGDPGKFSVGGRKVNTFEDIIKNSAKKGDGLHADAPTAKTYATDSLFGSADDNKLTLAEKFGQVSASMEGAGEANTATMDMKKAVDSFSTEKVRQVVNECKLASEHTLSQVAYIRSMRGPGPSMGGGGGMMRATASNTLDMTLAQGPKPPTVDLLDEESMVS